MDLNILGDASSPIKFILDEMHRRVAASAARIFAPDRGDYHIEAACDLALRRYGGVWGPFVGRAQELPGQTGAGTGTGAGVQ